MITKAVAGFALEYAVAATGLDIPAGYPLPTYEPATASELWEIVKEEPVEGVNVVGAYWSDEHVVFYLDSLASRDGTLSVWGFSILIHETVHYLQYANGWADDCAALEPLAYEVQVGYLVSRGFDPADFGLDAAHLSAFVSCTDPKAGVQPDAR